MHQKIAETKLLFSTAAILAGFYLLINYKVDFEASSISVKMILLEIAGIVILFTGIFFLYKTFKRGVK